MLYIDGLLSFIDSEGAVRLLCLRGGEEAAVKSDSEAERRRTVWRRQCCVFCVSDATVFCSDE